jgi:hypothetical protein
MEENILTKLTSDESFIIKDRGEAFVINERYPQTPWNPKLYQNMEVTINDKPYKVIGVEMFAINFSEDDPYTRPFSILGKEL